MFYDAGCFGCVVLGELPETVQQRLGALPGEWLEFDPLTGTIVVRHIQPSAGPSLPMIAGELVRMLSEIPEAGQDRIPGGDLFVHTEVAAQLVRLRVEGGRRARRSSGRIPTIGNPSGSCTTALGSRWSSRGCSASTAA